MNDRPPMTLAQRREALVAQCEFQRRDAGAMLQGMLSPASRPSNMLASLRERFSGRLMVPLALAGAVLGLIAARKKGALPMIAAAAGIWKTAKPLFDTLRQARSASLDPERRPL